jgi:hypothetical protein
MHQTMEQGRHMMMGTDMGSHLATGGLLATGGYIAGRGLLGGLLRNPLVLLAAGVAAGYFAHKYRKEIILAVSRATGAGKDFWLQQKESLSDLLAEAEETQEQAAAGEQPGANPEAPARKRAARRKAE